MKRYDCCIILLFIFFFFFISSVQGDDLNTMLALSRNLPPSSNNKNWNTNNKNPCMWEGVGCTSLTSHQVINLSLSGLGLTTSATNRTSAVPFFELLCNLNSLQHLDLSMNSFSFIPPTFFSNCKGLSQLKMLDLHFNSLNCNLSGFSSFRSLEALALSSNKFSGEIPAEILQLKNLSYLDLSMNYLSGTIPEGIAALPKLKALALSSNQFSGEIPAEILQLKNLSILDLRMNYLSGTIPEGIAALPKLKALILSFNNLTGEIPTNLSAIRTLSFFYASSNNLTGRIPGGITRNLKYLDLSYNQLTGNLSSDLLSPPPLKFVDLTDNLLDGPVPGNLSASLYRLRLGGNNLNGDISALFERPTNLNYLELENNQLNGEIPSQLGNCPKLLLLNLAANRLQGSLRKELGNLSHVVILKLQENNLSGEIPPEISMLANLSTLNISHNSLSGEISSAIFNLQKLAFLHLEGNKLSGQIPGTIINLGSSLIELQLGNNNLNGTVPKMPPFLSSLNLSSNLFSGPIPPYLGDLAQLEILDLSRNDFTGEVPPSLAKIQSLTLLVLSYNQLNGTLPHFPRFVSVNTTGNRDLLNSASPPPAPPRALSKKTKPSTMIIVVSVVSAIFGVGLLSAFLLILLSKRLYRVEDEGLQLQLQESPPAIIKGSFLTSDSKHRSSIDFTKAMEVVSSPSNIMLKTRFSTNFKASMPSGTCYTVKKLNWSDRIFQMGSNERFGQELKAIGRLTNSNIMVPLAYVLTRDSAYIFYENVHKGTLYDFLHKGSENSLDWQSRYSIALGVAQGLTFLHGCNEAVLLLDLSTKSIHLKPMNEPQIGDIELYKVIDPSKSTGGLSTVAGSVGYIPPEYAYTMRMTPAANVYSFGVILLELLTGKQSVSEGIELAKWAASFAARPEQKQEILDPSVSKASIAVRSQMLSVLKVALSCVSLSPEARPKMRNVLRMLFNAR